MDFDGAYKPTSSPVGTFDKFHLSLCVQSKGVKHHIQTEICSVQFLQSNHLGRLATWPLDPLAW
jgi:hypothetical protein